VAQGALFVIRQRPGNASILFATSPMVAGIQRSPLVLEVHPSVPVTSVPEEIAAHPSRGGGYFFAALTGSLAFSTVANSMFQSSPFTLSTLRI
jgi:hypothetical protein